MSQDDLGNFIRSEWNIISPSYPGDQSINDTYLVEPSTIRKNNADNLITHACFRLVYEFRHPFC